MISTRPRGNSGFSLIELTIVIGIIGVLSTLAIPKFQTYTAKARMAESITNLNMLHALQHTYHSEHDSYATLSPIGANLSAPGGTCPVNDLGFVIQSCNRARYQYSTVTASTAAFRIRATTGTAANNRVFPGCTVADAWDINQNKRLRNTSIGLIPCG